MPLPKLAHQARQTLRLAEVTRDDETLLV